MRTAPSKTEIAVAVRAGMSAELPVLRVGPEEMPIAGEVVLYKVAFPHRHYLSRLQDVPGDDPDIQWWATRYEGRESCPEAQDALVEIEPWRVRYTEFLSGFAHEPALVQSVHAEWHFLRNRYERIIRALEFGVEVRTVEG